MTESGPSGRTGEGDPRDGDAALAPAGFPDRRDGLVYLMPEKLALAVDVALATGRPLLLRGEPGTGKSSLAAYVARERGWRYFEHVVTSQTQARDLLWTFDSVRRLADAQAGGTGSRSLDPGDYIQPGVLWWALAPDSAARHGRGTESMPFSDINSDRSADHAVVLIDEIDKADPDLPNGLLVPLSAGSFLVAETGTVVRERVGGPDSVPRHLVIITTNEERELPEAFLRRCVVVWLDPPGKDQLTDIARAHLTAYEGGYTGRDHALAEALAQEIATARAEARQHGIRPASTAEYLDALRACRSLGIDVGSEEWMLLRQFIFLKPRQPGGLDGEQSLAW
jgi:MoxR-like ATPase